MANALSSMGGPPPAPNPDPMPQGGGGPPGPPSAGGQPPQAPPAPSHAQTVAALRHFDAIERELTGLLKDPDLGKTDMRSMVIDGATKLVASGIMTAPQAVEQLGTFPDKPFDQKKWVEMHYMNAIQGANAVLDHHRAAFAGHPPSDEPMNPDDHQTHMAGLMSQYQGAKNG